MKHRLTILSDRIKSMRVEAGHTQQRFADMIGTSQSYLWKLEAGRVNASVTMLCRVADALGTSVSSLIDF